MVKLRVNLQLEESLKQYCVEQAELYGISMGGFISMVVAQHRQQQESVKAMGNMGTLAKMFEELKQLPINP